MVERALGRPATVRPRGRSSRPENRQYLIPSVPLSESPYPSLFHYRNHGADHGRILVGIQVPPDERALFQRFLATIGYPCRDESSHPAYRLLLREP